MCYVCPWHFHDIHLYKACVKGLVHPKIINLLLFTFETLMVKYNWMYKMTRKPHRHLEQHEGEFMTHSSVYVLVNYCFNHKIAPLLVLFISFLSIMMFTRWDPCVFVRSLLTNMFGDDDFIKLSGFPLRKDGKRERSGKIKWCWHSVSDILLEDETCGSQASSPWWLALRLLWEKVTHTC